MVCFCNQPANAIPMMVPPTFSMALPPVPLQMQLALALPALLPENRLDMQIGATLPNLALPSMTFGGGPLFTIAPALALVGGVLPLLDIPQLEMDLQMMGDSLAAHLYPLMGWITGLKIKPLLNFALLARLVLDLTDLGIDPFDMSYQMTPATYPAHHFRMMLPRPQMMMAKLVAGLPSLAALADMFQIPTLGDPNTFASFMSPFSQLSRVRMPSIGIPFPLLSKFALVLNSLATIFQAFGPDGLTGAAIPRLSAMMAHWGSMPFPLPPMPALALNAQLAELPSIPQLEAGAPFAASMFAPHLSMSMPKLGFLPMASLMVGIGGSIELLSGLEPFDACSLCPFS